MKTSKHPLGTLVETDVLVIGAGASGCGAALGARDQGLDVVIMDKGSIIAEGTPNELKNRYSYDSLLSYMKRSEALARPEWTSARRQTVPICAPRASVSPATGGYTFPTA